LRNNAALEQMSEEVRRRLHREPREALAIANLSARCRIAGASQYRASFSLSFAHRWKTAPAHSATWPL